MEKNITFAPNVLLLDVTFLNETVYRSRQLLSERLGRELPVTDWVAWLLCVALDSGLRGENQEVQVLLVADEGVHTLSGCTPASLDELDGKACRTSLGEFSFLLVPSAGLVSRDKLYNELVQLALDAKEVEHLILVPQFDAYGEELAKVLHDFCKEKGEPLAKKAICFLMKKPSSALQCRVDWVTYSLMHVWGITPDDL